MVIGLLSHVASVAVGALYPAFKTFKVIREGNYAQMKRWLKYWTVYAGFLAAETIGDVCLLQYIVPGYLMLKLSFLIWTACPYTEGSSFVHQRLVAPLLTTYEHKIDEILDNIKYSVQRQLSKLGNGALERARTGLLSLAETNAWAGTQKASYPRSAFLTVAVEEQAEEDVVCLSDERVLVKMELEDHECDTSLAPNHGGLDSIASITMKTKRRERQNWRTEGNIALPSRRCTRRVRAERSTSRGR